MAQTPNNLSIIFIVVILSVFSSPARSQECSLPDVSTIRTDLRNLLISEGGDGARVIVNLLEHHFTCLAVASRDRYRALSVVVRYTKNSASDEFVAQFIMECRSDNTGTYRSSDLNLSPPSNVFSIETRRDCRVCTSSDADCARE